MRLRELFDGLARAGVALTEGLSLSEIRAVKSTFGLVFPPDLEELLGYAQPASAPWINWRTDSEDRVRDALEWPYVGLCFDIENNVFWRSDWGVRPDNNIEAFAVARRHFDAAPRLIPLFGHRYLPSTPCERGNPVFSVYQTDIIVYGRDLEEWIMNEYCDEFLGSAEARVFRQPTKEIAFWSKFTV